MKVLSAYNAILGQPELNALKVAVSTYHLLVKFRTLHGIEELRGDQVLAKKCYMSTLHGKTLTEPLPMKGLDVHDELIDQ